MRLFKKIIISLLLIVFIFSCKKDKEVITVDMGYNYFPQAVGNYVIYDVDSVIYDDFEHDTDYYSFRVKELTESIFIDNSGDTNYRIERYYKKYADSIPYDSMQWTLKNAWFATANSTEAIRVEENLRLLKLIFPVELDKTWNGNAYNTNNEWVYKYSTVNEPATIGTFHFDSTLTTLYDKTNLVERRYYKEVYAKNIGLVKRNVIDVYSGTITSQPVIARIEKGYQMSMTLVEYGKQ